jgi:hypothetical protein
LFQRRTLFGWISPVPRDAITATGEKAALTYLKDACVRLDNEIRPPPSEELGKAWTTLAKVYATRNGKFNDAEASYAGRVLELLRVTEPEKVGELVNDEVLWWGVQCLPVGRGRDEGVAKAAYLRLSKELFEEITGRVGTEGSSGLLEEKLKDVWRMRVLAIAEYGRQEDARDLISGANLSAKQLEQLWRAFLQQVVSQKGEIDDAELLPVIIGRQINPLSDGIKQDLSLLYASIGDMEQAKKFTIIQDQDGKLDASYINNLLKACRTYNDLAWGRDIIKSITANVEAMKTQKSLWNTTFGWALATGKSVDEVGRMIEIMARTNPDFQLHISDVNSLIEIANERNDPYMAERLVSLGERWGCRPDEDTYLLQIDYRLSVGDVEGARTAFDMVKSFLDGKGDAGPRVNRLVQAMCAKNTYSFDTIMDTVDFLGERSARFEAGTVAALAVLHLSRDEYNDVADLLTTSVRNFSLSDRAVVRKAILDLMLDTTNTPLSRLWDTYMIFQHVFEESPRPERLSVMQSFFDRDRPDMAIHVFNHMRRHRSPDINPDTETFITALLGCGRTHDHESLSIVNNVLKLDISISETTRLHNARMIAFFGTGESEKAQNVWEDIVRSDEGPSRNSLVCLFRVCEQSDFGEVRARSVWGMCRRMEVPVDEAVVAAYVGALAGNGCEEDARKVVESCQGELGVEVRELM